MKKNKANIFLISYFLISLLWWIFLFVTGSKSGTNNYLFAFFYGFIPFLGGILGIINAKKWGLFKSALGKGIFLISLGLVTWSIGETIWTYYNFFLSVDIPYPSWADAGFILSWPLWAFGVFYLSKATGAKYGLRKNGGKIIALVIPLLAIIISYYLLIVVARQGVFDFSGSLLKTFFDLAYPIGDLVILTTAFWTLGLSFNFLGGIYRNTILFVLLGFLINYISDFGFVYGNTVGTYYTGNWSDLLYAIAMFVIAIGINGLSVERVTTS